MPLTPIAPHYTAASQLSPEAKAKKLDRMKAERQDLDEAIAIVEAELAEEMR